MTRFKLIFLLLITCLFSGIYTLDAELLQEDNTTTKVMPSRRALLSQRWRHRQILLVYGTGIEEITQRYRTYAEIQQGRMRFRQLTVQSDRETELEDLRNQPVYLVGTAASNGILAVLAQSLPFELTIEGFRFNGIAYTDSTDILMLMYPNPENPQLALNVVVGNDDDYVLDFLQHRSITDFRGDYQIFRHRKCIVFGLFSQDKYGQWVFNKRSYRDYASGKRLATETDRFRIYLHNLDLSENRIKQIVARRESLYRDISAALQTDVLPTSIDYHIYPSFEDKGLITDNTTLAHNDIQHHESMSRNARTRNLDIDIPTPGNEVHAVYREDVPGDDGVCETQLILRQSIGKPAVEVLETGFSLYFTRKWRGKGYEYWASRLYLSGNRPSLSELLDREVPQTRSGLIVDPMAATFVAYLIDEWGMERFVQKYPEWRPTAGEMTTLEDGWTSYLQRLATPYQDRITQDRARFPQAPDTFQKGFCYAHEGYQIYNGYLSRKGDEALTKLVGMGSNAISITPFTSIRDPKIPEPMRLWHGAGSENDESIIHAALAAKQRGMAVMLKPHVWVRQSWPGEIEMSSEKAWDQFFDYYYRWIRHYALMAEMYEMDILCVGVELSLATVGHEDRWREMVRKIRRLYSGKLVYAANWGEEFENVNFWDAFDYIGVNSYYPLSDSEHATDEELRDGAELVAYRMGTVYNRYRKPLLITEIGYKSSPAPWITPYEYRGNTPVNLEHQSRAYEAMLSAMQGNYWWRGIYWWKWPSHLEDGGPLDTDFTPNDKPAQDVVARWYRDKL